MPEIQKSDVEKITIDMEISEDEQKVIDLLKKTDIPKAEVKTAFKEGTMNIDGNLLTLGKIISIFDAFVSDDKGTLIANTTGKFDINDDGTLEDKAPDRVAKIIAGDERGKDFKAILAPLGMVIMNEELTTLTKENLISLKTEIEKDISTVDPANEGADITIDISKIGEIYIKDKSADQLKSDIESLSRKNKGIEKNVIKFINDNWDIDGLQAYLWQQNGGSDPMNSWKKRNERDNKFGPGVRGGIKLAAELTDEKTVKIADPVTVPEESGKAKGNPAPNDNIAQNNSTAQSNTNVGQNNTKKILNNNKKGPPIQKNKPLESNTNQGTETFNIKTLDRRNFIYKLQKLKINTKLEITSDTDGKSGIDEKFTFLPKGMGIIKNLGKKFGRRIEKDDVKITYANPNGNDMIELSLKLAQGIARSTHKPRNTTSNSSNNKQPNTSDNNQTKGAKITLTDAPNNQAKAAVNTLIKTPETKNQWNAIDMQKFLTAISAQNRIEKITANAEYPLNTWGKTSDGKFNGKATIKDGDYITQGTFVNGVLNGLREEVNITNGYHYFGNTKHGGESSGIVFHPSDNRVRIRAPLAYVDISTDKTGRSQKEKADIIRQIQALNIPAEEFNTLVKAIARRVGPSTNIPKTKPATKQANTPADKLTNTPEKRIGLTFIDFQALERAIISHKSTKKLEANGQYPLMTGDAIKNQKFSGGATIKEDWCVIQATFLNGKSNGIEKHMYDDGEYVIYECKNGENTGAHLYFATTGVITLQKYEKNNRTGNTLLLEFKPGIKKVVYTIINPAGTNIIVGGIMDDTKQFRKDVASLGISAESLTRVIKALSELTNTPTRESKPETKNLLSGADVQKFLTAINSREISEITPNKEYPLMTRKEVKDQKFNGTATVKDNEHLGITRGHFLNGHEEGLVENSIEGVRYFTYYKDGKNTSTIDFQPNPYPHIEIWNMTGDWHSVNIRNKTAQSLKEKSDIIKQIQALNIPAEEFNTLVKGIADRVGTEAKTESMFNDIQTLEKAIIHPPKIKKLTANNEYPAETEETVRNPNFSGPATVDCGYDRYEQGHYVNGQRDGISKSIKDENYYIEECKNGKISGANLTFLSDSRVILSRFENDIQVGKSIEMNYYPQDTLIYYKLNDVKSDKTIREGYIKENKEQFMKDIKSLGIPTESLTRIIRTLAE